MNTRQHLYRGFHPCDNGSQTITLDDKQIKGEWVEGDLLQYSDWHNTDNDFIQEHTKNSAGVYEMHEVLPETVCEWTGRLCKERKVYEGDIIETRYKDDEGEIVERSIIRWNNDRAMFEAVVRCRGRDVAYSFDDVTSICEDGEVVGTIFSDAELLGGEK